jgi:hypothetical protein
MGGRSFAQGNGAQNWQGMSWQRRQKDEGWQVRPLAHWWELVLGRDEA